MQVVLQLDFVILASTFGLLDNSAQVRFSVIISLTVLSIYLSIWTISLMTNLLVLMTASVKVI